jgi:two-component system, OmpR family, response regulator MtrA
MANKHVLYADDDLLTHQLIRFILQDQPFQLTTVLDGRQALDVWSRKAVDLFLLDWSMPVMDGLETLQHIRQVSGVPVILLTAKDQEHDIIAGLTNGANDYIVKPFKPGELLARIQTRLRRGWQEERPPADHFQYGELTLELKSQRVRCHGQTVELSRTEFQMLAYLLSHIGLVVSKQELLQAVWGYSSGATDDLNLVEAAIARLRKKLKPGADCPEFIQTVRGTGYRLGA